MVSDFSKYEDEKNIEVFPQGKLFRISFDLATRNFKLLCYNEKEFEDIRDIYSDVNPACFYMKQYGYNVSPKIYIINQFGFFPPGFIFQILKTIKMKYGSLSVVAMSSGIRQYISDYLTPLKKTLESLSKTIFDVSNISEDSGRNKELISQGKNPYLFRDYQKISVENLIFKGYGRGLLSLPTSSGKSNVICNLIYNLQKNINSEYKCLILVPNKQLVFQMYNDFLDYGYPEEKMTKFTAGLKKNEKYNPEAKVIIANRQYVFTNKSLLPKCDVLFCDEAHQTWNAESTKKFIDNFDCPMKFGCSGSLPKDKYGKWVLTSMFGNIVHSEEISDLQKRGFVSKLKIYQLNIIDSVVENNRNYLFNLKPLRRYSPDENGYSEIPFNAAHDSEHEYYEKYYRELYKPALEYVSKFNDNTLILFDRIEFGKRLTELSEDIFKNRKIHYIDGSVPVSKRLEITKMMEETGDNILFAEFATFSTGINVKRLTNLVFVSSSKSFPRILQSIGRTLRLHDTKTEARIFDISFNFKYSRRHLIERLKIYKEVYHKTPDEKVIIQI